MNRENLALFIGGIAVVLVALVMNTAISNKQLALAISAVESAKMSNDHMPMQNSMGQNGIRVVRDDGSVVWSNKGPNGCRACMVGGMSGAGGPPYNYCVVGGSCFAGGASASSSSSTSSGTMTGTRLTKSFGAHTTNTDPSEVKALQHALVKEGFLAAKYETGTFGFITEKALMNFQTKYNIEATGFCGEKTRGKVNEILTK